MVRKKLIFLLFTCFSCFMYGQSLIDSLEKKLPEIRDTHERAEIFLELAREYAQSDFGKS